MKINHYLLRVMLTALVLCATLSACESKKSFDDGTVETTAQASAREHASAVSLERGKYLVTAIGCGDCHTPMKMGEHGPEPDMTKNLSGHPHEFKITEAFKPSSQWLWSGAPTNTAFAGPWGVSYAANLTPDSVSGLGIWTKDMFINAIRQGKHMGTSRPIMPPMPWPAFRNFSDDDLESIFIYLRSIPSIRNQVPSPQLPAVAEAR